MSVIFSYFRALLSLWWLVPLFVGATVLLLVPGVRRAIKFAFIGLDRIARLPGGGPGVVFIVALIAGAAPSWLKLAQLPSIPDEFSYLLAADTFLHGRLANPAHKHWRHFQSTHILASPTYASKYPPGQGIALAGGTLAGSARIGAYGAVALGCAAACWALQACMPARWAVVISLILLADPYVFDWGQIFWGGGVAMIGGALVTGAALRSSRQHPATPRSPRSRYMHVRTQVTWPARLAQLRAGVAGSADGLTAGVGFAILANSRPFEGAVMGMLLAAWMLFRARRRGAVLLLMTRFALPAAAVLLPVVVWMLYYNYRVTFHALRTPYAEHARQYTAAPLFFWQNPKTELDIDVPKLRVFHSVFEFNEYREQSTLAGFLQNAWRKNTLVMANSMWPTSIMLVVAFGAGLAFARHSAARLAVFLCPALVTIHFLCTPWLRTQYLAPLATIWWALVGLSLLELRRWGDALPARWRAALLGGDTFGLSRAASLALLGTVAFASRAMQINQSLLPLPVGHDRVQREIRERVPGEHLVFVRYEVGPQHPYEWVYNPAEIDEALVVFAHELDAQSNTGLIEYFPGRSVWLLSVRYMQYELAPFLLRRQPYPTSAPNPGGGR